MSADLVEMAQQIGDICVDAKCPTFCALTRIETAFPRRCVSGDQELQISESTLALYFLSLQEMRIRL
jgi:hypothetical protein